MVLMSMETKTSSRSLVKVEQIRLMGTPITWQICLYPPQLAQRPRRNATKIPQGDDVSRYVILGDMYYNFSMTNPRKQPNSRMCFICGLENPIGLHLHIYETEPGIVESTYFAPEHFQGYPGVLH